MKQNTPDPLTVDRGVASGYGLTPDDFLAELWPIDANAAVNAMGIRRPKLDRVYWSFEENIAIEKQGRIVSVRTPLKKRSS